MRKELVTAGHRREHLGCDPLEPDPLAGQERAQRAGRPQVRRSEQHQLAHARRAIARDQLVAPAVEHVDSSVTKVVARDQTAHAVRDQVHAQHRIAVIAADGVDQALQRARVQDVVLPPVVREDVIAPLVLDRGGPGSAGDVAAESLQGVDERAVESLPQHLVGKPERLEIVRLHGERFPVELQFELPVVAEQHGRGGPRPHLDLRRPVPQTGSEQPWNDDDRRRIGRLGPGAVQPREIRPHWHAARRERERCDERQQKAERARGRGDHSDEASRDGRSPMRRHYSARAAAPPAGTPAGTIRSPDCISPAIRWPAASKPCSTGIARTKRDAGVRSGLLATRVTATCARSLAPGP